MIIPIINNFNAQFLITHLELRKEWTLAVTTMLVEDYAPNTNSELLTLVFNNTGI